MVIMIIIRNVLGTKNLGDILSERESIAKDMQVGGDGDDDDDGDDEDFDVDDGDDDVDDDVDDDCQGYAGELKYPLYLEYW